MSGDCDPGYFNRCKRKRENLLNEDFECVDDGCNKKIGDFA